MYYFQFNQICVVFDVVDVAVFLLLLLLLFCCCCCCCRFIVVVVVAVLLLLLFFLLLFFFQRYHRSNTTVYKMLPLHYCNNDKRGESTLRLIIIATIVVVCYHTAFVITQPVQRMQVRSHQSFSNVCHHQLLPTLSRFHTIKELPFEIRLSCCIVTAVPLQQWKKVME